MTTYNRLAAIKEIGAAMHRIMDANLDPAIKRRCLHRNLDNLIETLPVIKFAEILARCQVALREGDYLELVAGLSMIDSMIPRTYGMLPAGAAFKVPGNPDTYIKRKGGVDFNGQLVPHPLSTTTIIEVSA